MRLNLIVRPPPEFPGCESSHPYPRENQYGYHSLNRVNAEPVRRVKDAQYGIAAPMAKMQPSAIRSEGARQNRSLGGRQAARTLVRNFDTSLLRRPESLDSDWAAESTCEEADPVSVAPRCTSVILAET